MRTYQFFHHQFCEMCGSDSSNFKILGKRLSQSQGRNPKMKPGITVSVWRCQNCNLVFTNPMPIPGNISDHYETPPESYWKDSYFTVDSSYFSYQIQKIKEIRPDTYTVLDIGAGIGKAMVSMSNAGFDTWGIEPSEAFCKMAFERMDIPRDRLLRQSVEEAEFPKEKFDFISFGAVLEHLYHPSESIKKVLRWLKPGGIVYGEIPSSKYLMTHLQNTYYKFKGMDYVANLSPMHVPFHLYEFSSDSFSQLGKRLSFEVAETNHFVGPIYGGIPKSIQKPLKKYMKKKNSGMQLEVWLRKL